MDRYQNEIPLCSADDANYADYKGHAEKVFGTFGRDVYPLRVYNTMAAFIGPLSSDQRISEGIAAKVLDAIAPAFNYATAVTRFVDG